MTQKSEPENESSIVQMVAVTKTAAPDPLVMLVVTKSPSDFPDLYVARKNLVTAKVVEATLTHIAAPTLVELHDLMPFGMVILDRQELDEPHIVETWL